MKRIFTLLMLSFLLIESAVANSELNFSKAMEETWKEFRQIHPYGYQTVAIKHIGEYCLLVISEPSENVTEAMLHDFFQNYGGSIMVKHQPLGYGGWLADVVGVVNFPKEERFNSFTQELFTLLYGTDYKAFYTDLDHPSEHVYFSEYRLNFSISAAELSKWFIADNELFKTKSGNDKTVSELLVEKTEETNQLFYSKERGFVVWVVSPDKISNNDKSFKLNARKFALDTDLIIGAMGNVGKNVAIIARERIVPVTVLPPLRIETIQLLATTNNDNLAQSFERHNIFAGKTSENADCCPIYLSDELWHTEYGNLLNFTDQMLKGWCENNNITYRNYHNPSPIDWAFNLGVHRDLGVDELTYNWNTAGAGYVIQDMEKFDVFAVNRTGCLPVSFIPSGMEGKVDDRINEAEELAYDFFSELNSPELVREVQYAIIYQIFRYFRDSTPKVADVSHNNTSQSGGPSFSEYEKIVENLLQIVSDTTSDAFAKCYMEGFERFAKKYESTDVSARLKYLIQNDPYNGFYEYIVNQIGEQSVENLLNNQPTLESIKRQFDYYLSVSMNSVRPYIEDYKKRYGSFPFSEAAKYIVSSRYISEYTTKKDCLIAEYNEVIRLWINKVNEYNKSVRMGNATLIDESLHNIEKKEVDQQLSEIAKKIIDTQKEIERILSLTPSQNQQQALGSLNWLLTDPGIYEAPIGEFYASKFISHKQWLKSSPIACSFSSSSSSYGGHNLDAHITPIKASASIPKNYCRVSVVRGQRVVSVGKADKARITPTVLRTIERKAVTGDFKLPAAPIERPKSIVLQETRTTNVRGLDIAEHNSQILKKQAFINGKEVGTISDIQDAIAAEIAETGTSSVKEIHFKGHTAREVHVYADNLKESIVERLPNENLSLKNFDINEDIQVISQGDGTVKLVIQQRPETLPLNRPYKAAMLDITVPEKTAGKIKDAIIKVFNKDEKKIDNRFKWKRELKLELQQTLPEIDSYDIKDEFIQIYGHIFNMNYYEIIFELAA